MAITAAKLRVEIGADTQNAEAGMNRVQAGMQKLGTVGQVALGTVLGSAVKKAGEEILGLGGQALDAYSGFERMGMSMQQLVAKEQLNTGAATDMASALGMSADAAQGLLKWNQKLAIDSPFTSKGVNDAFSMAMAYGFNSKQAKRLTQDLIDFSAGAGKSENTMQRVALALGQINAKGKLAGQEVLQLTEAGISVDQILAKAFNKSTAEIVSMREDGLIPADQAIEAIAQSLEKDFGGAAKRQSESFSGLISSLEDIKEIGLREAFSGVFEEFKPDLIQVVSTLQDPKTLDSIRAWGNSFAKSAREIVSGINDILGWYNNLENGTQTTIIGFGLLALNAKTVSTAISGIVTVASGLTTLISGVSTTWAWLNTGFSLTTSLQEGLGLSSMAISLGAVGLAVGGVAAAWLVWNETIVKTNRQIADTVAEGVAKDLDIISQKTKDNTTLLEEYITKYKELKAEAAKQENMPEALLDSKGIGSSSLKEFSNALLQRGGDYETYYDSMMKAAEGMGMLDSHEAKMIMTGTNVAFKNKFMADTLSILTKEQWAAARAVDPLAQSYKGLDRNQRSAVDSLHGMTASFLQQSMATHNTIPIISSYTEAMEKVTEAQDKFNQSFGDQVVSRMEQMGIKGEKYTKVLDLLDQKYGTNYLAQYEASQGLDEILKKYQQTGDIDVFGQALEANKTQWEKLDDGIQAAKDTWDSFVRSISSADGMHVTITADVSSSGGSSGGSKGATGSGIAKCFVGSTLIDTPQGPRPISALSAGDEVLLLNEYQELEITQVEDVITGYRDDLVSVETSNRQVFHCSPNHPFKTPDGFIWAGTLQPGTELISTDASVSVLSVAPYPGTFRVFDIRVYHPDHTFLVGGICVHNKEPVETRASGGPGYKGDWYLTGEEGPELIRFPRNGTVFTNKETQGILNSLQSIAQGATGASINVNIYPQQASTELDYYSIAYTAAGIIKRKMNL